MLQGEVESREVHRRNLLPGLLRAEDPAEGAEGLGPTGLKVGDRNEAGDVRSLGRVQAGGLNARRRRLLQDGVMLKIKNVSCAFHCLGYIEGSLTIKLIESGVSRALSQVNIDEIRKQACGATVLSHGLS